MKTAQLRNHERDRWTAGDGHLAELVGAAEGSPTAGRTGRGRACSRVWAFDHWEFSRA